MVNLSSRENKLILLVLVAAIVLFVSLAIAIPVSLRSKSDYLRIANRILDQYILIDGHNDLAYKLRMNSLYDIKDVNLEDMTVYNLSASNNVTHTDLIRLREGKLGGQFWAIYADCNTQGKDAVRVHLEQIDLLQQVFAKYPNVFKPVTTANEFREAFFERKIGSVFGVEGGHAIDSSLSILRILYQLGVRYMTLSHNCNTPWCDTHQVDSNITALRHDGLTEFGKIVVAEMNRLGMMIDLSHVSHKTMLDVLEITRSPVIFSHSSVYKICNHTRNVRDDVLLKLKANRGVIMINFYNLFISCNEKADLKDVVAHVNYVRNLIGADYVGLAGDYDGVKMTPVDLEDVSKYPNLFAALLEDGWSEDELVKLAGANILRVMEENEKYAASVRDTVKPYNTRIDQAYIKEAGFSSCRT